FLALLFVFFFQAEDGIRDLTVTGVQTCALPISRRRLRPARRRAGRPRGQGRGARRSRRRGGSGAPPACAARAPRTACGAPRSRRSEERRVGKEGRARGGAGA